jgi:hypothetical protein
MRERQLHFGYQKGSINLFEVAEFNREEQDVVIKVVNVFKGNNYCFRKGDVVIDKNMFTEAGFSANNGDLVVLSASRTSSKYTACSLSNVNIRIVYTALTNFYNNHRQLIPYRHNGGINPSYNKFLYTCDDKLVPSNPGFNPENSTIIAIREGFARERERLEAEASSSNNNNNTSPNNSANNSPNNNPNNSTNNSPNNNSPNNSPKNNPNNSPS